ncbi:hypothetical protein SLS62_002536 [Diatrype stigma]|uniref:Uncharacterized protein n=1 Tax=Diatrype stigma TaxID=117547 RepID=A0AAN9YSC2_9PEZI
MVQGSFLRNARSACTLFPARSAPGCGICFLMYASSSSAACSGVTVEDTTASVSPLFACVRVHHSSIRSILSFVWCTTVPQPCSSTTWRSAVVMMQKISMISSLSGSRPVI